jgi:DNA topoisomerase-1
MSIFTNLVIVESPTKAKTIQKYLDNTFKVISSFGHIADLPEKKIGIDIDNNFQPTYAILKNKVDFVQKLKNKIKKYKYIWLATDEDREGEAISWHLYKFLKIPKDKVKRITFHEITKKSIHYAIDNPRKINKHLVNAQQARRILDRLVGFKISPILWKNIQRGLSAGRVQSVALRLIVDREKQITTFISTSYYQIKGIFIFKNTEFITLMNKKIIHTKNALLFLNTCINITYFNIYKITKLKNIKYPPPPFKTSTLQQEALKKLNFSIKKTMLIAQKLYEKGFITYIRTDSTNICIEAIEEIKHLIIILYGKKYSNPQKYKPKNIYIQEAHEAIRPTNINYNEISKFSSSERALYKLIKNRTLCSQMNAAEMTIEKIYIKAPMEHYFILKQEKILFDGFLKVYTKNNDNEINNKILFKIGDKIKLNSIICKEMFNNPPKRYNEGSLVKKLEHLKIGRPSTYAPIISTIQKRNYVNIKNINIIIQHHKIITLKNKNINTIEQPKKIKIEKQKFIPTTIGYIVSRFLVKNFKEIVDYSFTAKVEESFDKIAKGKILWTEIVHEIYYSILNQINKIYPNQKDMYTRLLGIDPINNKKVWTRLGPFGPIVQIGDKISNKEKPKYAVLLQNQDIDSISLQEALILLQFPKKIGKYQNQEIICNIGKYGPYIKYNNAYISLKNINIHDLSNIKLKDVIQLIINQANQIIKTFSNKSYIIKIVNGKYGPYIRYKNKNYKIPKNIDVQNITLELCKMIIKNKPK